METLMLLTYTALCYAIFKIFKIPLNSFTVPTAVLGGVAMIGTVLLLMNYNHPYTKFAQTIIRTTPIVPNVKGLVIDVPVIANVALKKGHILFKIDPIPYKNKVDELSATLAAAKQQVKVKEQNWEQAKAQKIQARSERNRAKENYERYVAANAKTAGSGPYSVAQIQNMGDSYNSAEALFTAAKAQEASAQLMFQSLINGVDTDVAGIAAKLAQANFDLDSTIVRAPTDGMVTQLALRPGAMAVPIPLRPSMIFIHDEPMQLVASFQQNLTQRLEIGATAEVIFKALPGDLITGKVISVAPVIDRGSFQTSGTLIAQNLGAPGRIPIVIELDQEISNFNLPAGSVGEVAIITEHVHHVALIRRILLRMKSWQNYLFSEGH